MTHTLAVIGLVWLALNVAVVMWVLGPGVIRRIRGKK
jgi:hypothetical protein